MDGCPNYMILCVEMHISAEEPELKDEIREAGGIEVLVKLLSSKVYPVSPKQYLV